MTVQSQVSTFVPGNHGVFARLDVDKRSIAVSFADHTTLLQSVRLSYSSEHLLHYLRKPLWLSRAAHQ